MAALPPDLRKFLYDHLETLEELELVLLFARHPDALVTIDDAEAKLQIPFHSLAPALQALRQRGLCEAVRGAEGAYQLTRRDPLVRAGALQLAALYEENRYEIVKLIAEAAMERVRGSMTKAFADAFVLGGKKKGDG